MKKIFSACAGIAACAAVVLALVPAAVGAATLGATTLGVTTLGVTTGPATDIGQTSATFNGYLNPPSAARSYYFVYGTSTSYGQQTPSQPAPPGLTLTRVEANVTGLSAGTTYHYALVAVVGVPPLSRTVTGGDQTFTTAQTSGGQGHGGGQGQTPSRGRLKLAGGTLQVNRGRATVALWCFSSFACRGTFSISGSHRACLRTKAFALDAAVVRALKAKLSGACRKALRKSRKHEFHAQLSATLSTGQPSLNSKVMLVPRGYV